MGLETIALVSAGLQVAGTVAGYFQQKSADKKAKQAAFSEAALMEEDAKRAALQERIEADRARKKQKTLFLKSGVDLTDSPLLVMEETRNKGEENAKNIIEGTAARASLVRQQGSVGRASLLGSLGTAAGQASQGYTNYSLMKKQIV